MKSKKPISQIKGQSTMKGFVSNSTKTSEESRKVMNKNGSNTNPLKGGSKQSNRGTTINGERRSNRIAGTSPTRFPSAGKSKLMQKRRGFMGKSHESTPGVGKKQAEKTPDAQKKTPVGSGNRVIGYMGRGGGRSNGRGSTGRSGGRGFGRGFGRTSLHSRSNSKSAKRLIARQKNHDRENHGGDLIDTPESTKGGTEQAKEKLDFESEAIINGYTQEGKEVNKGTNVEENNKEDEDDKKIEKKKGKYVSCEAKEEKVVKELFGEDEEEEGSRIRISAAKEASAEKECSTEQHGMVEDKKTKEGKGHVQSEEEEAREIYDLPKEDKTKSDSESKDDDNITTQEDDGNERKRK